MHNLMIEWTIKSADSAYLPTKADTQSYYSHRGCLFYVHISTVWFLSSLRYCSPMMLLPLSVHLRPCAKNVLFINSGLIIFTQSVLKCLVQQTHNKL